MQKSSLKAILDSQPQEVDVNAFLEDVLLREKLEAGESDIAEGRVVSHDEAKRRLAKWLA